MKAVSDAYEQVQDRSCSSIPRLSWRVEANNMTQITVYIVSTLSTTNVPEATWSPDVDSDEEPVCFAEQYFW
jgi:hypothetical protein